MGAVVTGGGPRNQPASRGPRNIVAFVALACGLASLVPWVIVLTFPLAIVFGVAGLLRSMRLQGDGRSASLIGIGVAFVAAIIHLALAGLASLIGLVADAL